MGHRRRSDRHRAARRPERRRRAGGGATIDLARGDRLRDAAAARRRRLRPVFSPDVLVGRALWASRLPGRTSRSRSPSRCSPTRRRDRLEPRRGGSRPRADRAGCVQARCGRRLRDLLHAPARRPLRAARAGDRRRAYDVPRAPARGGRLRQRPDPRGRREPASRAHLASPIYVGARGDDPLHRDERGVIGALDHVLDGELPAAPRGPQAAAPALQDPAPLVPRRDRADPGDPPRRRQLRGTLYSLGATLSFTVAHVSLVRLCMLDRDGPSSYWARPNLRAGCFVAVRHRRGDRDRRAVPRARRPERDHAAWPASRMVFGLAAYLVYRRFVRASARGQGAPGVRAGARTRVPATPRARDPASPRTRPWTSPAGWPPSGARGSSR